MGPRTMLTFTLKFLSGKYLGGEFVLPPVGELIIGRAADVDVILAEEMVSRRHARLVCSQEGITLTDLDSTNGCFVNGEKVRNALLQPNDRILVGTSILRLIASEHDGDSTQVADAESMRGMLADLGERNLSSGTSMTGDLADVPLPDLLQLFASNRKNGTLQLTGETRGTIYLKEGNLQTASLQGMPEIPPMKALSRMLSLKQGLFQFEASSTPPPVASEFQGSTEGQLMEALRLVDEAARVQPQLPPLDHQVQPAQPLRGRLTNCSPAELDIFQASLAPGLRLRQLIDRSAAPDHEVMAGLVKLLKDGLLTASDP